MNILFLTNHLNIGGISSYVVNLSLGLKQRGHNVYVASSSGELVSQLVKEGVVFIPIPIKTKSEVSYKVPLSFFKLLGVLKEKNIEIIHANTRVTQVLSYFINSLSRIKYVTTCHGFFKTRFSRKLFPCWGERTIAISEAVKDHLVRDFRVKEEKIRVIRHGIDMDKYRMPNCEERAEIKRKLGMADGPVVGIIARLSEEKGHIYLIEAVKKIIERTPGIQLLIVGEGRMKERLSNLVEALRIEKHVFFLPATLNTKEILSAMDVFVLPSSKEGLGFSLMEAMAMSLPVIGTDIGGIRDLIQNKNNGLLVKPRDPGALSLAIIEILSDPKKAKSFGENAANFIKQNFSGQKMALETEGVYLECLDEKD